MSSYLGHYAQAQHRASAERRVREGRTTHDQALPSERGRVWRHLLSR